MTLHAAVYTEAGVEEFEDVEVAVETPGPTWVHGVAVDDPEFAELREAFGLHPLALEAIEDPQARPKTEEYEGHTFVLLKTASLARGDVEFENEVATTPIGLFLGDDWLVTLSPQEVDVVEQARTRVEQRGGTSPFERGPDFLAYRILDGVVDSYFGVLAEVGDEIDEIESRIVEGHEPDMLDAISDVRRDLLAFRKIAWPTREAISVLSRGDTPQIQERNEKYYRSAYDHLVQVVDLLETYRDLVAGSRDIYLNQLSQSTNEVMKVLTIVATIFIPLTFVAGVYGMNFAGTPYNMPELEWTYGYPAVMLGMVAIAAVMLVNFRRRGWI